MCNLFTQDIRQGVLPVSAYAQLNRAICRASSNGEAATLLCCPGLWTAHGWALFHRDIRKMKKYGYRSIARKKIYQRISCNGSENCQESFGVLPRIYNNNNKVY